MAWARLSLAGTSGRCLSSAYIPPAFPSRVAASQVHILSPHPLPGSRSGPRVWLPVGVAKRDRVPTIQPSTAWYRAIVAWESQESVCMSQQGGVDTVTARSLGRQVVVSDGARERHLRPSYLCSAPSHSAVSSSSTSLPQSSTGFLYYNLLAILPFSGARTALPYRGHSVTLINAMRAMSSSHVEKYLGRDPGPLYVPASSDRKERWRIGDFDDAGPLKKRLI